MENHGGTGRQRDQWFCLVRFPTGGGMRISSKRLYATQEEAEKVVEEWRAQNEVKIAKPVVQPEPVSSTFHFHDWI